MNKRLISLLLIFAMIIPLTGCGGGDTSPQVKEESLAEGVLNEENLVLGSEGVELRLDPVLISSDTNAKITKVSNAPPLDEEGEIDLEVYDFSLEGITQVDGVIQLAIPLDLAEGEIPGAAYLNETTGQWEPVAFMYDEASGSVVILTDHLSKYGVFTVTNEGTRRARLEFLGIYGENKDEDFLAAIEEYSIGGVPAAQCIEIGAGAAGDAMQLGSDFLGGIVQSAGYLAYGEDVVSNIGDHLGNIGLMVSVVQIGTNIYNGKINDALVGSMKLSHTYIMSKVASKLSSSVMSASMAAVAIVDYAINKFGTTAIEGRADIYRDAYSIYYTKGEDGFKGSDYWYKTFYPMFKDPTLSEEALKAKIDAIITEHCNEFWTGTNKLGVDYFVSEAREKFNWTGGGAGLNKDLQDSISQERRAMLYNDILPGVFNHIALKINMENEIRLREEYKALSDYLNTSVKFTLKDPKKTYAGHQAKFSPLSEKAVVKDWSGKFQSDGSITTSFTLYGHMLAGSPTSLKIWEPDADIEKDEPVRVIDFKVTPPLVEIVLGEEIGSLKYEGGDETKILQLGLHATLREADTITINKDGSFKVEVGYATASGGSGDTRYTSEVNGITISGNIDAGTLSGSGTVAGSFRFTRKEISPLDAMEGETKEYVTTDLYDDSFEGTVDITGSGDKVTFEINLQGTRIGSSKLQYHSIDPSGNEFWGDNPTVTDKSGEISTTGKYTFTVQK